MHFEKKCSTDTQKQGDLPMCISTNLRLTVGYYVWNMPQSYFNLSESLPARASLLIQGKFN
jgi:hypothetical protein